MELATKLQTTGYRIGTSSALLARSDQPPRGAQPLLEACVDGFNRLWDGQPPLARPRPAGSTALMRQHALADPVRGLFSMLACGLGPTPPCGSCSECAARELAAQHPAPTRLGRKMLAQPGQLQKLIEGDAELTARREALLAAGASEAAAARDLARLEARRALADALLASL